MAITVHHGDSREVLKGFDTASVDSVVCDPPYGLNFMGKRWDTGETAFDPLFWVEVLRVLKPGGHLIAFSGTRTYHRLACAIEDAGFEMRDMIAWLYGSGFPKSHDVSKGIDKAAGAVREVVGTEKRQRGGSDDPTQSGGRNYRLAGGEIDITAPATDAARQWQGWGTALKPALEPIVLARKPLAGTVAANVLQHGTGALNIDASRIGTEGGTKKPEGHAKEDSRGAFGNGLNSKGAFEIVPIDKGRWPANVCHDGSEEVTGAFPERDGAVSNGKKTGNGYGEGFGAMAQAESFGDSGSAARFFYSAKADAADRCGSKHPTVKPVDLMAYLVRLVTPPGGVTLDPFAGSGSTGMACLREGFDCILIEREAQYVADIHKRLAHVSGEDAPLFAASNAVQPSFLDDAA